MNFCNRTTPKLCILLLVSIFAISWLLHYEFNGITNIYKERWNGLPTIRPKYGHRFDTNQQYNYKGERLVNQYQTFPKIKDLDIFQSLNVTFVKEFQNPCWYEWKTTSDPIMTQESKNLRCLPAFLIIGMPKCGTTDLFNRIKLHPQVRSVKKGLHWWTRKRFNLESANSSKESFSTYVDNFSEVSSELHRCLTSPAEMPKSCKSILTFDASPSTMWDNKIIQNYFNLKSSKSRIAKKILFRNIPQGKFFLSDFRGIQKNLKVKDIKHRKRSHLRNLLNSEDKYSYMIDDLDELKGHKLKKAGEEKPGRLQKYIKEKKNKKTMVNNGDKGGKMMMNKTEGNNKKYYEENHIREYETRKLKKGFKKNYEVKGNVKKNDNRNDKKKNLRKNINAKPKEINAINDQAEMKKELSLDGMLQIEETVITPPMTISPILPNAKIVILLRDPVQRLYSEFTYSKPKDPAEFDKLVDDSLAVWNKCRKLHSVKFCIYDHNNHISDKILKINIGAYSVFLKDWLQQFPVKNILILKTEKLAENLEKELVKTFNHLSLRSLNKKELRSIIEKAKLNSNRYYDVFGPMLNKTRRKLREFYRPFNDELGTILNDRSFVNDWL